MFTATDSQIFRRHRPEIVNVSKDGAAAIEKELNAMMADCRFLLDRDAGEVMGRAADVIRRNLDSAEVKRMRRLGDLQGPPLIVVKGLPQPVQIPPTPFRGFGDDSRVQFSDALLLGIYGIIGITPVAYDYENHGHLFRNVVPNPDSRGQASSHGFDAELGWHTDNPCGYFEGNEDLWEKAGRSPIPHYLGFVALRNRDRRGAAVPTEVLVFEPVLARMNEQAAQILSEDEFQINPPASNGCAPLLRVPIVVRHDETNQVRFNANPRQVVGLTERAQWAIEEFRNALSDAEADVIKVDLQPGMVMVFDNYRVAHRRHGFDPGDDFGQARWLRRCFGCKSLDSDRFVDALRWPNLLR